MMKKILLLTFICLSTAAAAQTHYACFSWNEVIKSMPEYKEVQTGITTLKQQYAAEMTRAEQEFNTKYEAFIEGQRTFAPSIMKKRQAELRDLMEKNIAFRQEAERLLQQAEDEMMAPVIKKMQHLLQQVGEENGYAFIINTDGNACPYTNPAAVADITNILKERARAR